MTSKNEKIGLTIGRFGSGRRADLIAHYDMKPENVLILEAKRYGGGEPGPGPGTEFLFAEALQSAAEKVRQIADGAEAQLEVRTEPPAIAEFLVDLLLKGKAGQAFVGDLEERFRADLAVMSVERAKRRYWARALKSIGPLLWTALKRIGFVAAVIGYVRSLIG